MAFNNIIDRTGADALIPVDVSREIIKGVAEGSAVLQLGRRLPDLPAKERTMPVLDALIEANFVNGDTGLKQTSETSWSNLTITAEEIAVIIPVPDAVLDDAQYDIWGELRPLIVQAFGRKIDGAVLIGTNAPAAWPDDLLTQIAAASQTVDYSTQLAAGADLYDMILGEAGLVSLVEEDGFMVNGHVANLVMRGRLRGVRDATGQPIFMRSMQDGARYELDGSDIFFLKNGAVPATSALMFSGDWDNLVYAMRQDITYTFSREASIQDGAGNTVYNAFQQDGTLMRAVMRLGYQILNPINATNETEATRFPFSALVP